MKILIALIALLLVGCVTVPLDTVVLVRHDNSTGSGVLIFTEGNHSVIITALHNVQGVDEVTIVTFDNEIHTGRVIKRGTVHDLALIAINKPYTVAKLGTPQVLPPLTKVVKVGAGGADRPFPTEGIVAGFHDNIVTTTTPVWFGDSGGGLFYNGRLVGIIVRIGVYNTPVIPLPVTHLAVSENIFSIMNFIVE